MKETTSSRREHSSHAPDVLDIIDVLAKLIAAIALVLGAYIANSFQSKMTGTTLLSQREDSETQLRASMLNSLVEPVIGAEKGTKIPPESKRLLVELLALNFHEHFELNPLMVQVDREFSSNEPPDGMSVEEAKKARESLRSVARRVSSQQIASLIREETGSPNSPAECRFYLIMIGARSHKSGSESCHAYGSFNESISLDSPDHKYTIHMVAADPDFHNQTLLMTVSLVTNDVGKGEYQDIASRFVLGWFDFPLTDNTLLPDGNRFAFSLEAVNDKSFQLRLIWFPKNYFTPRERPLDYREYLQLVGKNDQ